MRQKNKPNKDLSPSIDTSEEIQLCLHCEKEKCSGTKKCLENMKKRRAKMENKNEFGMPVMVFEDLREDLWDLREMALEMTDTEAGRILYRMGRIIQEILNYIPTIDDEDLEREEKHHD